MESTPPYHQEHAMQAPAAPGTYTVDAYQCSGCKDVGHDLPVALYHMEVSNRSGAWWQCPGCGQGFCSGGQLSADGEHFDQCDAYQMWAALNEVTSKISETVQQVCNQAHVRAGQQFELLHGYMVQHFPPPPIQHTLPSHVAGPRDGAGVHIPYSIAPPPQLSPGQIVESDPSPTPARAQSSSGLEGDGRKRKRECGTESAAANLTRNIKRSRQAATGDTYPHVHVPTPPRSAPSINETPRGFQSAAFEAQATPSDSLVTPPLYEQSVSIFEFPFSEGGAHAGGVVDETRVEHPHTAAPSLLSPSLFLAFPVAPSPSAPPSSAPSPYATSLFETPPNKQFPQHLSPSAPHPHRVTSPPRSTSPESPASSISPRTPNELPLPQEEHLLTIDPWFLDLSNGGWALLWPTDPTPIHAYSLPEALAAARRARGEEE